jgi:hypothetical protein
MGPCWKFCQTILATTFCVTRKMRASFRSRSVAWLGASHAPMTMSVKAVLGNHLQSYIRHLLWTLTWPAPT